MGIVDSMIYFFFWDLRWFTHKVVCTMDTAWLSSKGSRQSLLRYAPCSETATRIASFSDERMTRRGFGGEIKDTTILHFAGAKHYGEL